VTERTHRGGLEGQTFTLREGKDGRIHILWRGRRVATLKGAQAMSFRKRIDGLDEPRRQLAMAKITGNFKRGNEKDR
jgi:hypothetical protein